MKVSKTRIYQLTIGLLAIALITVLVIGSPLSEKTTIGSGDKLTIGEETIDYINQNYGATATLKNVEETNGVYKITAEMEGQETELYVSKDGDLIFPVVIPQDAAAQTTETPEQPTQTTSDVPKTTQPLVELFVMSHCPYGTQMEKGILPVVKLLGDKIDFELKFVYYSMHGDVEVKEQLNQYCIQKQSQETYLDYLSCFLEDGDTERCMGEVGITEADIADCVAATDEQFNITANLENQSSWLSGRYPKFDIFAAENEAYGVGGSPTLVINGQQVQSGRDSASILAAVCDAFENPPAECEETLSSVPPSQGFGGGTTASTTDSTCG